MNRLEQVFPSYTRTTTRIILAVLLVALFLGVAPAAPVAAKQPTFPERISLPNGFQPEGIALGYGHTFYAGSIPTGAIYRGSLLDGSGEILVPGAAGRSATGMKLDRRSGYLFVSGATTGKAFVYDGATGQLVQEYTLTTAATVFINDVIVTKDAAYFTNSYLPEYYRLPLGSGGQLPDPSAVQTIPLSGDWQQVTGFNANGIDAAKNGKYLIIVNSTTGNLYRVDPLAGVASLINLGGATVVNGDGILLFQHTLYVVQNQNNQITVIQVNAKLTSGTITGTINSANFDVPTTIARFGHWLYAVNARFNTPPTPDTEYWVAKVHR